MEDIPYVLVAFREDLYERIADDPALTLGDDYAEDGPPFLGHKVVCPECQQEVDTVWVEDPDTSYTPGLRNQTFRCRPCFILAANR